MITGDVRRAIARAIAAEGLPPAEPGLRPTGVPGRYGSSVAFAFSEHRPELAARVAARLTQADGIARAEVTGPGFITVTIDPEALAALPDRIITAGPNCATSDALAGVTVPAPPAGDPLAEAGWEPARAALARQLTARLAAAAGATVATPEDMERSVAPNHRQQLAVRGEATDRYEPEPGAPVASPQPDGTDVARTDPSPDRRTWPAVPAKNPETAGSVGGDGNRGERETPAVFGGDGGDRGRESPKPESPRSPVKEGSLPPGGVVGFPPGVAPGSRPVGWPPVPSGGNPIARAVAFAGADAVRFALARAVPGRPAAIEAAIIARHVPENPAYAVRYAHARAASGVRWAAPSPAVTLGERAALRPPPADPGELVLLDALSWLPERVAAAARRGRPDEFARYLEELASATIAALVGAGHPDSRRAVTDRLPTAVLAKAVLATAAQTGLAAGLGLLGVGAPDRL